MRTTEEIKKQMTDNVLANATLCQKFGLDPNQEWDAQTSSVSVLNLIFYIVAMAIRTLEWLHDQFRLEIEERIAAAFPGSVSWYWNKAMQFRYGYQLDQYANYYDEALTDDDALIIKHCAIIEVDNGIAVKVNKDNYERLTDNEKDAFTAYMDTIKFAGTTLRVFSDDPDELTLELYIWRDPQVLGADLLTLSGQRNTIQEAIVAYLDSIVYGGVFNKTKLIDAVQAVEGVIDVTIDDSTSTIHCPADTTDHAFSTFNQNFTSRGGHFQLDNLILENMTATD